MLVSGSEDFNLLDRLAEEFAERVRRGDRPTLKEFTDRYPDLADAIRELFPALDKVERADGHRQGDGGADDSLGANLPLSKVGDYRIVREIGRGGMGIVYEAEQISLGRRVALKVLPRQMSSDRMILERFRRESRAAARLHHTNIVPVYEVGQDGDIRFYAMQFIQGQGLDKVISELRRLRDLSGSEPKIKEAALRQSVRPRPEHSDQGLVGAGICQGGEVSPVLQSILIGRFDPDGRFAARAEASEAMLARAVRRVPTTHPGTGVTRRTDEADPVLARTEEAESVTVRLPISPLHPHPTAPGLSSTASPSSTSAILPGPTQLSSAESGRRQIFRSLATHRPAGRRGPRVRARARHRTPGHQAVELAPGHRRGGVDHGFRPGQGGRRRADADRRHPGHDSLHGPRTVSG